jgi:hypothetical protein
VSISHELLDHVQHALSTVVTALTEDALAALTHGSEDTGRDFDERLAPGALEAERDNMPWTSEALEPVPSISEARWSTPSRTASLVIRALVALNSALTSSYSTLSSSPSITVSSR